MPDLPAMQRLSSEQIGLSGLRQSLSAQHSGSTQTWSLQVEQSVAVHPASFLQPSLQMPSTVLQYSLESQSASVTHSGLHS